MLKLTKLGKKWFEALLSELVDKALQNSVELRLVGTENRLAAIETRCG